MRPPLIAAILGLAVLVAARAEAETQDFSLVDRGHQLAVAGDCAACHTVPGSGHPFAGGRAIETPFGKLLAPNITPDRETGIGAWSDDEFVNSLTQGTGRNGEHLYPAMPYPYLTKVTRDDALTIRAYLNSIPAVWNPVRSNQLPFPYNIRALMRVWDALFFTPGSFQPVEGKSEEWNRGGLSGRGADALRHVPYAEEFPRRRP
jgi:mono/diheme cytochrome c family protein